MQRDLNSSAMRLRTATSSASLGTQPRPMTSKQAAGFVSGSISPTDPSPQPYDPLRMGSSSAKVETFDERRKAAEKRIQALVDESFKAQSSANYPMALERARDAAKKERDLVKEIEKQSATPNPDLTFCVMVNLATAYQLNRLFQEALNTFQALVNNKTFNMVGRLRVNMGNIYFEMENYVQAIKMFRMSLDQIPKDYQRLRVKIYRNISMCYIRMGQLQDAIIAFETISETMASHEILFNLVVAYHSLNDIENMKTAFHRLVFMEVPESSETSLSEDNPVNPGNHVFHDNLRQFQLKKIETIEQMILIAARIVAISVSSDDSSSGYEWVISAIKETPNSKLAGQIEVLKVLSLMRDGQFSKAIETLETFEKLDNFNKTESSMILSVLKLKFDDNVSEALAIAERSVLNDRFNVGAISNKGSCHLISKKLDKAREAYETAIQIDSLHGEALHNFGLLSKIEEDPVEALRSFEKVLSICQDDPEDVLHIAQIYEKMGDKRKAIEWFERLVSLCPTDPSILLHLAKVYSALGDTAQAYHYYSESYRFYPNNINTLTWLGTYYVENEMYERAIKCFYRGALLKPAEIKWQLMVASCLRRTGNYQSALDLYKKVHEANPDNIDCLKFLVRLCSDMGLDETQIYTERLNQLERAARQNSLIPPSLESSFTGDKNSISTQEKTSSKSVLSVP